MTLIFGVSSSLYIFGTNEDGESVIGHIFHVEATDEKGNRFVHDINYPSMKWRDNDPDDEDDMGGFVSVYAQAEAKAKRLASSFEGLTVLDSNWHHTGAIYGSDAYNEQDTINWEKLLCV